MLYSQYIVYNIKDPELNKMESTSLDLTSVCLVTEMPILDPASIQASFQHLSLNQKEQSTNPPSLANFKPQQPQITTSLTSSGKSPCPQLGGLATKKLESVELRQCPTKILEEGIMEQNASNQDSSLDVNQLIESNVLQPIQQSINNPYLEMEQLEYMLEIHSSQQPERLKVPREIRQIWSRDVKPPKKRRYKSKLPMIKLPEAHPVQVKRQPKPRVLYPREVRKPSLSYLEPIFNPNNIEEDGRTTLMIKNIPQGYNQELLASEIDYMHYCTYNFLYLPYDHIRQCCYKYAFINFKTPAYLKYFYTRFLGRRWYKIKSDTVCDLRYARIQGKDNLTWHLQKKKQAKNKQIEEEDSPDAHTD